VLNERERAELKNYLSRAEHHQHQKPNFEKSKLSGFLQERELS